MEHRLKQNNGEKTATKMQKKSKNKGKNEIRQEVECNLITGRKKNGLISHNEKVKTHNRAVVKQKQKLK